MRDSKRDTDIKNRLLDSVGEGEGGMIWENSIETCILPYVKQMTSPSLMHETGHSKSVHWDNPERWDREGDGSGVQDGGHLHTCGWFMSVQSFSCVSLFATPWTAARQASLSITNSWSLRKLMSIESVMPSIHLILCHPLLLPPSIFPSIRVFSNESVLGIRCQSIGASASISVLPMNT